MTKKDIVRTIAEQIDLPQLRTKELVQRTFDALIEAQLRVAVGASVVFATDTAGTWVHHPDPDATILARVRAGDGAYRLTTVAPNHALLKQIFDRLLGRPGEALAVDLPVLPQVSDAELAAPLAALLSRWPGADG